MVKAHLESSTPTMNKKYSRSSPVVTRALRKRKSASLLNSPVKETSSKDLYKESADLKSHTDKSFKSETKKARNASTTSTSKNERDSQSFESTNKRKRSKSGVHFDLKGTEKVTKPSEIVELDSFYEVPPKTSKLSSIKKDSRSAEIAETATTASTDFEEDMKGAAAKSSVGNKSVNITEKENFDMIEEQSERSTASIMANKKKRKKKKKTQATKPSEKDSLETKDMVNVEEDEFPGKEDSTVIVYEEIMDSVSLGDSVSGDKQSKRTVNESEKSNPPETHAEKTYEDKKLWVENVENILLTYEGDGRVKAILENFVTSSNTTQIRKRKRFVKVASILSDENDAEVAGEAWNIVSASRCHRIIIPETELQQQATESLEKIRAVDINVESAVREQPGLMIKNLGHIENTVDIMNAISASGNLKIGRFHVNFYPKEELAILVPDGTESKLDSNKLGKGLIIDGKLCQVVNLGPAKQGRVQIYLEPVRLLVFNVPDHATTTEVKEFFPKCKELIRLGQNTYEATYANVEEAKDAITFSKTTKFEGQQLLCYFCKRSSSLPLSGPKKMEHSGESTKTGKSKKSHRGKSKSKPGGTKLTN